MDSLVASAARHLLHASERRQVVYAPCVCSKEPLENECKIFRFQSAQHRVCLRSRQTVTRQCCYVVECPCCLACG